jgi:hypothetical protein
MEVSAGGIAQFDFASDLPQPIEESRISTNTMGVVADVKQRRIYNSQILKRGAVVAFKLRLPNATPL